MAGASGLFSASAPSSDFSSTGLLGSGWGFALTVEYCAQSPIWMVHRNIKPLVFPALNLECSGGGFRNVLVIAADALSRFVDWSDRGVCILFGDAAGAVMVQACESEEYGLFGFDLHSDGEGKRHLNASIKYVNVEADGALGSNGSATDSPPRRAAAYSTIDMNGKEVFHFAARSVPLSIESALEKGWNE